MYLSGSAAGREPMVFAVYGDYPPRLPQESYNMADLGTHGGASGSTSTHNDGFYDAAVCAGHKLSHMGETVSRVQHSVQSVCHIYNRMCSADGGADLTTTLYVRYHAAVTTTLPHATPQRPPTTFTPPTSLTNSVAATRLVASRLLKSRLFSAKS